MREFTGDTYFPIIDEKEWRQVSAKPGIVDEKNKYAHEFIVLERVSNAELYKLRIFRKKSTVLYKSAIIIKLMK